MTTLRGRPVTEAIGDPVRTDHLAATNLWLWGTRLDTVHVKCVDVMCEWVRLAGFCVCVCKEVMEARFTRL